MSTDRVDLKTEILEHIRISDKKTTARPPLGTKLKIELTDYRNIRQCRSCGISASNKHVDDLVPDKSYFLVLAAKLVDGRVLFQRLCGVTSLLQHNSAKGFCVCFDASTCSEKSSGAIQPVINTNLAHVVLTSDALSKGIGNKSAISCGKLSSDRPFVWKYECLWLTAIRFPESGLALEIVR